ncbi:MAG TPA: hypothetical protein VFS67_30710 [Polyangiaceae bacterium]|nr:hypothetical protein [Polyangiaceae bacterium]
MTRVITDHVICDGADGSAFRCLHCGARHASEPEPMLLEQHLNVGRGFILMHKLCRKVDPPSRQMVLPGTQPAIQGRASDLLRELEEDDASGDLPTAPEVDQFVELYPMARTHEALRDYLADALAPGQYEPLPDGTVEAWGVATGVFDAVAHWARIEKAHRDAAGREPIAGLCIPRRIPMPEALQQALAGRAAKKRSRKA